MVTIGAVLAHTVISSLSLSSPSLTVRRRVYVPLTAGRKEAMAFVAPVKMAPPGPSVCSHR